MSESATTDWAEELALKERLAASVSWSLMVTASGLLRAADLAAFELGMWQGWTGR